MPRRPAFQAALVLLACASAHAAVIRGKVTSALGVPSPGARVQLIRLNGGARSVGEAIAGVDGSYEIRTGFSGHFVLLTSPPILSRGVAPQIGTPFYAGENDVLLVAIALNSASIASRLSAEPTGAPTPLAELASPVAAVPPSALVGAAEVLPELRDLPGVFSVQLGPMGNPASLYVRGASPQSTAIALDGVPVEDLGGGFDLSTLSATGLAGDTSSPALELNPTPLPLAGLDAEAGTLVLHTVRASTVRPSLVYAGDAGPLDTLRNEAIVSASPGRADLLASFSRFDTANEGPAAPFHLATAATNLGYGISAGTSLRLTARRDVLSGPLPEPFALYNLQPQGKDASQNLYTILKFDTCTAHGWCNGLSSGLVRKREQVTDSSTTVSGLPITITGANGYTGSSVAAFPSAFAREDLVTDRDVFSYDTRYRVKPFLQLAARAAYQDERGADILPGSRVTVERQHISGSLALQGELLRHRVFYEASGLLEHSNLLGLTGAPRVGLTYAPVRPGSRKFRGTVLHLDAAAGVREPSLEEQRSTASPATPTTRTLEMTVDQTLLPGRLTLRATYFHSQFAHQFELLAFKTPSQTLAYRAQGLESELRLQPFSRFVLLGGYSYLASLVERSAATPAFNPAYPGTPIGALTALAGARPFHRPPHSGFASVQYGGRLVTAGLRASVAGRSDDSTNLPQTPALLLPNRNLSPGYTSLDANIAVTVTRRITVYSDMTNLLGDRHMAPIGFTSTPFVARTGLRIRLGGE